MATGKSYQEAFDRGNAAGRIEQRLDGHDEHFRKINGSIADNATAQHDVALALQRLTDQIASDRATAVATATALREALEARRAAEEDTRRASESSWSPRARRIAVLGAVVGVLVLAAAIATVVLAVKP